MISHLSHRLLPQGPGWTTPTGSGNADVYAAQDAQRSAAPNSAAAMAANVSAAAGLGAQPTSFAAAMNAASTMPGAVTDDDGDSEGNGAGETTTGGASSASDPQQLALAGPLLGHHHGSLLTSNTGHGAALPGAPGQSQGQGVGQNTIAPSSSVANALHTYQSVAGGLH